MSNILHYRFRARVIKFVIVFTTYNFIVSQCQGQERYCYHNQFRCNDGRCLPTEALCNKRRDCPSGEDEFGSNNWNCRSQILAQDSCDSSFQFRCRFGGCIPRSSLCNGYTDCWGGGDEAVDICPGGRRKQGSSSPPITRPVQEAPPPPPAPRPTQPAPTSRPAARPQPRPTQAPIPNTTSRSNFPGACGPINEDSVTGFKVTCENRLYEIPCSEAPSGAVARYTCMKYYTPTSNILASTERKCEGGQWSPLNQRFGCEPDCGISASETGAFIVGGSAAKEGKWPWMVAIYERNSRSNKLEFICGASLISARAVITAAHCVVRRETGTKKFNNDLRIVMGKYYRRYDKKGAGEQERTIAEIFVHQEYNPVTLSGDIAIIKLAQPVDITEYVRPVCLPRPRDYTEANQLGTLVGWGRANGKQFHEQLQQAELPVILSQKCIEAHPQFAHLVHQGTFCAGYRNGTSACDGDSGGPLVFRDRYSPSKYLLHGIVSAGIAASDGRSGCNPNYYTVFTDVAHATISRWISYVINNHFQL